MSPRKKEDFKKIQEASREKILMAAFELFAEKGYATTSIDSIAKQAGISKGLIYHYFESKEEILKGIFAILMQRMNQFMIESKGLPPEEYIRKMIDNSFKFIVHQAKINRLVMALALQPKVVAGLKDEIGKIRKGWMKQLILMFEKLSYEHPEAEAYLLGAFFDGASIGYQTFGKAYPINEMKRLILRKYNF